MLLRPTTTENENWIEALGIKRSRIPVLIIGNNPIEMTSLYNVLIGIRSKSYLADVCFDIKDGIERIVKTRPEVVFIDDNLNLENIQKLIRVLRQNIKTQKIKLIALKSSNWNMQLIDNVDDYILKDTLNAEILDRVITKNLRPVVKHPA